MNEAPGFPLFPVGLIYISGSPLAFSTAAILFQITEIKIQTGFGVLYEHFKYYISLILVALGKFQNIENTLSITKSFCRPWSGSGPTLNINVWTFGRESSP